MVASIASIFLAVFTLQFDSGSGHHKISYLADAVLSKYALAGSANVRLLAVRGSTSRDAFLMLSLSPWTDLTPPRPSPGPCVTKGVDGATILPEDMTQINCGVDSIRMTRFISPVRNRRLLHCCVKQEK